MRPSLTSPNMADAELQTPWETTEQNSAFDFLRQHAALSFEFKGQGAEYFKIWIVNVALMVLTLGVYYAWAKVRRKQYFHRNTYLDGSSFDYHVRPVAILKGWLLAIVFYALISLASYYSPTVAVLLFIPIALLAPWLIRASLRFAANMTSYRGVRFQFQGSVSDAYKFFLLWPILALITLNLMAPFAMHRAQNYLVSNLRYGDAQFAFDARVEDFYKIFMKYFLLFVVLIFTLVSLIALNTWVLGDAVNTTYLTMPFVAVMFLLLMAWLNSRLHNLIWSHTQLEQDRMFSRQTVWGLAKLYVGNMVGMLLTLGLFYPFMAVRNARYRLEHMGLASTKVLSSLVLNQKSETGALGEEASNIFDVDIAI